MTAKLAIVADSRKRAADAHVDRVRREVEAQFAERLQNAGFWRRRIVHLQMKREIRRRLEQRVPRSGLYLHGPKAH